MKVLDYSDIVCQMCNHFYFALQCYISTEKTGEETSYLTQKHEADRISLENKFKLFGIDPECVRYETDKNDKIIPNSSLEGLSRYKQRFGEDFSNDELDDFIKKTFIKSGKFSVHAVNPNVAGLHIRNKDYLQPLFNVFDRTDYLTRALESLDSDVDTVEVFSDDIEFTEKHYDDILRRKVRNVNYNRGTTDIEDFVKFACIKNKILWNSTFSYWAAFIGNVLYPDSYRNVISQENTILTGEDKVTMNPRWRFI